MNSIFLTNVTRPSRSDSASALSARFFNIRFHASLAVLASLFFLTMPVCTIASGPAPGPAAAPALSSEIFRLSPEDFLKHAPAQKPLDRANVDPTLLSAAIFHATNRQRARHRLPPLLHCEAAKRVAEGHSQAMATGGFFAHKNPKDQTRRTMQQRLRSANLKPAGTGGLKCGWCGGWIFFEDSNSKLFFLAFLPRLGWC